MLSQELHPGFLHARIVAGGLDEVQEGGDGRVEALLQRSACDSAIRIERLVRGGQREHIGEDAGAEVFERNAQRPEERLPPIIEGKPTTTCRAFR